PASLGRLGDWDPARPRWVMWPFPAESLRPNMKPCKWVCPPYGTPMALLVKVRTARSGRAILLSQGFLAREGQMSICLRRREFIAALGGAAAWPLAARAQQGERVRRIGVLTWGDENDPVRKTYVSAFTQALAGLGWTDGRNLRMDLRWHDDDTNRIRAV